MATETQTAPPPITFPSRVLAIPLVHSGLETIHTTLSTSPYIGTAYVTSTSIAASAYGTASRMTAPVYPRVLPVITAADGYANKGLDTLQSRFPYPFESSPETVYNDLKKAPEDAKNVAKKTIDERITTPAYDLAKHVDSHLAPLVNLLESILTRIHATPASPTTSPGASTSTDTSDKAQVTRARELVVGAKDHIIVLTTEQAKALRAQNIYIQRAAEQAESINTTLSSQYQNAQAGIAVYKGKGIELTKDAQNRIYALSHTFVAELEKVQHATATLPAQIQATFKPLTDEIGSTIVELKSILTSQEEGVGVGEKASRVGAVIKQRIGPIVEQGKSLYVATVDRIVSKKDQAEATAADTTEHLTNGAPS